MATHLRKFVVYTHLLRLVLLALLDSQCAVLCEVNVITEYADTNEHKVIEEDNPDRIIDGGGNKHCTSDAESPCIHKAEYLDTDQFVHASDNRKDKGEENAFRTKLDSNVEQSIKNTPNHVTDEKIIDDIASTSSKSDLVNDDYNVIDLKASGRDLPVNEEAVSNIRSVGSSDEPVTAHDNVLEKATTSDQAVTDDKEHDENEAETEWDSEQNSFVISWLKYLIEPFIEEFKEGISTKPSDIGNTTDVNISSSETNNSVDTLSNVTVDSVITNTNDSTNSSETVKKVKFQCTARNITDNTSATVSVVSSGRLLQLLSFDRNETDNVTDCLVVMFYAPWCHFCADTAPHYNALARAFPELEFVAVDTAQFSNLLARFGTVSVPNILVFHQSRAAVKFNQTERTFDNFVSFVKNSTGLEPNATVNITDADYIGPVSSVPTDDPDYLLWIAWTFVVFYTSCMFVKSNRGQQWIMRVRVLWQEHQHID